MNKRLTLFLLLGLAVAAVVGYLMYRRSFRISNDEAPIIVKNGSMTAEITLGAWVDGGAHWSHVTGTPSGNDLVAQIELKSGSCQDMRGNQVQIDYSVPGEQTTFHGSNTGTRLTPKREFPQETTMRLRRGQGDGGHITGVRAGGGPGCNIAEGNLVAICIWKTSSFNRSLCR